MMSPDQSFMLRLREALVASWDELTAYGAVKNASNPALGQCYPTARVVQHYYPATEIIKGKVSTGEKEEIHFWNGLLVGDNWYHIDFSWGQFPTGSVVREFVVLDRRNLDDSKATLERCALLLKRVETFLSELQKRGVTIERQIENQDYGCRDFDIRDVDGHLIGIGQNLNK